MRAEFDSNDRVVSRKYGGIESTLALEWEFATAPRDDFTYPGQEDKADPVSGRAFAVRSSQKIESLMKDGMVSKAKLSRSEVIALRLYTGIGHGALNDALRQSLDNASRTCGPPLRPHRYSVGSRSPFLVTTTVLNSAITKLRSVSESRIGR